MAHEKEVVYDDVSEVPMLNDADAPGGMGCAPGASAPSGPSGKALPVVDGTAVNMAATQADGLGCHSGKEQMLEAARAAGKSEVLDRYAADYPKGPHDQPQSMCPAFGSLRVGLRMRRTATILSGSACCVYGLTFTSHFYGARRTVGYVPFNSETLVTGKLFEDIRDAVHATARPEDYDAVGTQRLVITMASYSAGSAI